MVSSLDTLDPVTAMNMESLEHASTSEHYTQDCEIQEPDSDTERLVRSNFVTRVNIFMTVKIRPTAGSAIARDLEIMPPVVALKKFDRACF